MRGNQPNCEACLGTPDKKAREGGKKARMDDSRNLEDEPQGGPDVQSWRTPNGVGHRFDDHSYVEWDAGEWLAICGVALDLALPDRANPVDCMACIAKGWL